MKEKSAELVRAVKIPGILGRTHFPSLGADLFKYSPALELSFVDGLRHIELHLSEPYNTHWEQLRTPVNKQVISVLLVTDQTQEDELDNLGAHADIVVDTEERDEQRIGRILASDAKFFDIRSKRDFPGLLVHIIDTLNKAHFKKLPTTVNTYKAQHVTMLEEDDSCPVNSVLASLLRNIPGVSEDVAKALTREFKTVGNLIDNLHTLDEFRVQTSASSSRSLTKPVVLRIRTIFAPTGVRGSDVLGADE